jgi:hypothetical protein
MSRTEKTDVADKRAERGTGADMAISETVNGGLGVCCRTATFHEENHPRTPPAPLDPRRQPRGALRRRWLGLPLNARLPAHLPGTPAANPIGRCVIGLAVALFARSSLPVPG